MVQLPLTLEQTVLARAVDRTGAAETVLPGAQDVGEAFAQKLEAVASEGPYADAARRFAAKYSGFDPGAQVARMAARVEELLCGEVGRSVGPSQILNASPERPRRSVPAGVFLA
jgi:hypothetical protein